MENLITIDDVTTDDLLTHCRGSYQRELALGARRWSGSDLRGKARKYSGSYARSRASLLDRWEAAGYRTIELYVGRGGRKILVVTDDHDLSEREAAKIVANRTGKRVRSSWIKPRRFEIRPTG